MAIATNNGSGTSATGTLPSHTTGQYLVVALKCVGTPPSSDGGSTWTRATFAKNDADGIALYYKQAASSSESAPVFTVSSGAWATISENFASAGFRSAVADQSGFSQTPSTTLNSLTVGDQIKFAAFAQNQNSYNVSSITTVTVQQTTRDGDTTIYATGTADATSETVSLTWSGFTYDNAVMAAFQAGTSTTNVNIDVTVDTSPAWLAQVNVFKDLTVALATARTRLIQVAKDLVSVLAPDLLKVAQAFRDLSADLSPDLAKVAQATRPVVVDLTNSYQRALTTIRELTLNAGADRLIQVSRSRSVSVVAGVSRQITVLWQRVATVTTSPSVARLFTRLVSVITSAALTPTIQKRVEWARSLTSTLSGLLSRQITTSRAVSVDTEPGATKEVQISRLLEAVVTPARALVVSLARATSLDTLPTVVKEQGRYVVVAVQTELTPVVAKVVSVARAASLSLTTARVLSAQAFKSVAMGLTLAWAKIVHVSRGSTLDLTALVDTLKTQLVNISTTLTAQGSVLRQVGSSLRLQILSTGEITQLEVQKRLGSVLGSLGSIQRSVSHTTVSALTLAASPQKLVSTLRRLTMNLVAQVTAIFAQTSFRPATIESPGVDATINTPDQDASIDSPADTGSGID